MRPGKDALVLKHPNNDSWRNALLLRKSPNYELTARRALSELFPGSSGNQSVRAPSVRLGFEFGVTPVHFIHENILLTMQQNMRCFVEEAEPQVIV